MKKLLLISMIFGWGGIAVAQLVSQGITTTDGKHYTETVCFNRQINPTLISQAAAISQVEQTELTNASLPVQSNAQLNAI